MNEEPTIEERLGELERKVEAFEKKKPTTRFKPPTVEEITAYCRERNNSISPTAFFDHYETSGWIRGKNTPIKNWRAAVRTWEPGSSGPVKKSPILSEQFKGN